VTEMRTTSYHENVTGSGLKGLSSFVHPSVACLPNPRNHVKFRENSNL